jgi:hypothetical protein
MSQVGQLGEVADRLDSLGGLAERHFAAIGGSLEQAVGILAALTDTFQALLGDLRGSELAQSGQDLAAVAARVGTLSGTARADVATLQQLAKAAGTIDGRVARMHTVLREVDILAMNARLVAAAMGDAGSGFLPFADEIRRSATVARSGLDLLARELTNARQQLQAAEHAGGAFVAQHAGTMQAITGLLAASVASIEGHVTQSGNAAAVAAGCAEEIRGQIAAAIVALQLGDITRQRIEHMHRACQLLAQDPGPPALGYRLVAAQLLDVADELERGAARVVCQLEKLAADAGDIASQGNQVYGASSGEAGSFLGELEADTQQAQALFGHLRVAHAAVNPRIAAVLQSADALIGHIATIRSVEADIHIMGINTTLKSDRLGVVGRPLSVISQAVRDYGRQTAQHAAAVLEALRHLRADAGTLAAADAAQGAGATDSMAERMTAAVRRLGATAERTGAALTRLAIDGEAVAHLLHTAVAGFGVQADIVVVLREAAAACGAQAGQATDDGNPGAVLSHIAAGYTMANERAVHARFAPLPGACTVGQPAPADAAFADILF